MPYINQPNSKLGYFGSVSTGRCTQCHEQLNGFGQGSTVQDIEKNLIDKELKRGTSAKDVANEVFWRRHPEYRDLRLPTCARLKQLNNEWKKINAYVTTKEQLNKLGTQTP